MDPNPRPRIIQLRSQRTPTLTHCPPIRCQAPKKDKCPYPVPDTEKRQKGRKCPYAGDTSAAFVFFTAIYFKSINDCRLLKFISL
jgi:hypothetical protein